MIGRISLCRPVALGGAIVAFAGSLLPQVVTIAGTGDPNLDVQAIQAAVNQGGTIIPNGHFSFDKPPSKPEGAVYSRMITV